MKNWFYLIFFFIFGISYSGEKSDSTRSKLNAACSISLNSNGISTIPAFSLGEPAIMSFITLSKGRFSYDPLLAYDIKVKPWFIDNWFHYLIVNKPAFIIRTGLNFSVFFSDLKLPEQEVLQGQRYWAAELAAIYKITPKSVLTFMYWNDRGQDPGTLKGHFLSLTGEQSKMEIGRSLLLDAALQIFFIDYDGNRDGLFISPKVSSSLRNFPVSLFLQAIQPLFTNITPSPGFEWNIGVSYTF